MYLIYLDITNQDLLLFFMIFFIILCILLINVYNLGYKEYIT